MLCKARWMRRGLNKEEQALKFAEIGIDIFSFLPFVKIQEPGT